jgi:glucose-1-phosphate adenylyltransferase
MNRVEIGRYCRIRNAIIDRDVKVPDGATIGFSADEDRARGYHVAEGGIVVVPSAQETYATIAV